MNGECTSYGECLTTPFVVADIWLLSALFSQLDTPPQSPHLPRMFAHVLLQCRSLAEEAMADGTLKRSVTGM